MALLFLALVLLACSSPVVYTKVVWPALNKRRHYESLTNIQRLERELGIGIPAPPLTPPTAQAAAIHLKRAIEELVYAPGAKWVVENGAAVRVHVPLAAHGAMSASSYSPPIPARPAVPIVH